MNNTIKVITLSEAKDDTPDETYEKLQALQKRFPNHWAWDKKERFWRKRLVSNWEDADQSKEKVCKDCLECIDHGRVCYCDFSYG